MILMKKTVISFAIVAVTAPSWAGWETCDYQGRVIADGGTKVVTTSQANNTWDDWVWRGKQDGTVQFCSTNSRGCSFTWGKSKSTSYSHTTGWSVEGGLGFPIKALGVSVGGEYQRQKTWTQSQSENFDMRTDMRPGQWAQPVIVAVRRWKTGHFNGGHFMEIFANDTPKPGPKWGCYQYEWAWKSYGKWGGNEQQWGYKMIHVVNNRNSL